MSTSSNKFQEPIPGTSKEIDNDNERVSIVQRVESLVTY